MLNLLYRLVEIEARFACLTMGLDPLLGVLHVDDRDRHALVLDLMEPVRPIVDAWILDLLDRQTFRKIDFHERRDGVVSVLAPLSHAITETMPLWAAAVAPWTERAATVFAHTSPYPIPVPTGLPSGTGLTGPNHRRQWQTAGPSPGYGWRVDVPSAERPPRGAANCAMAVRPKPKSDRRRRAGSAAVWPGSDARLRARPSRLGRPR
jgi:hypothetical protein